MKLGCSSWSYHAAFREGRIDLREWLRRCAEELEVDGVELLDLHFPSTEAQYLRELKRTCVDLKLTIAGIGVSNDFGADGRRVAEVEKVQHWCDIAAYLGAPIVRVFGGWSPAPVAAPESGRIVGLLRKVFGQGQPNARRLWSDVAWALRQSADHAGERGVVLALQNNGPTGLIRGVTELQQALHDVGSPWLRVCLDPASLPDTVGLDRVMPRVVQARARMREVRDDGSTAEAHWPELLRLLRAHGYRGSLLVDYEGAEDAETAAPRAVRYLRGMLHLLERQQLLGTPAEHGTNGAGERTRAEAPAQARASAGER
ncbi:MAG TPA: sugar phosphate isomerase/epimerase family protein [Dehalococcoidia bacterium]|nr:sugar phosphate isomerase/epimerase family protein [Dehalococcoidia bacterium]